jgi:hypothetical protein
MALGPTQSPIQWVPGAPSLGVERPGLKLTTHLHLVQRSKNAWSYTSAPQYAFMAWCLVKDRHFHSTCDILSHLAEVVNQILISSLVYKCTENCEADLCVHSALKKLGATVRVREAVHHTPIFMECDGFSRIAHEFSDAHNRVFCEFMHH